MGEWECAHCGYVTSAPGAPVVCPECGAPQNRFEFFAYPDGGSWEEEDRFIGLDIPERSDFVEENRKVDTA